jgi:hypothetical protein
MGLFCSYPSRFSPNLFLKYIGFVTKKSIFNPYYFTLLKLFYPVYVTFVLKLSTDEHRKAYFKRIIEMEKRF